MAEAKSRFIIKRRDGETAVDDVIIETEGLSIGRAIQNDLVLNNRAVSRTHAGIKQLGADFWIYNLSTSNGTLLNGELVEQTPIQDGDHIQIGPFILNASYADNSLQITVEREIEVRPQAGQTGLLTSL